ncbi:MFS transporter [Sphingobium sp. EP60837]|uniref:MFS transporter n=1 Tax=Sphingobium sp. EP60837 TaxID=1855519 RepID=UPI0018D31648|nr:MFS transporter [Sphingobium sp. EP60837]
MTEAIAAGQPVRQGRGGMLVRAMLAQNVGTGCAFGGLGISVLAMQERYHASLGTATMGLSLTVLSMTALGPMMAGLISRYGLRSVMTSGVAMSLLGYLALAFAPTMALALAACALLIGPGSALFAALPPAVLASGWYPHDRGKVMGIAYLPLLVTFLPLLGVDIIQRHGLTAFYLSIVAIHLLLLPLMLGVADPPEELLDEQETVASPTGSAKVVILGSMLFWVIVVGDGILNGTAIAGSAHMLPVIKEYGVSLETGAMLLSSSGVASIIGSLVAGYACDRVGSATTLALSAMGFALAWTLIAITGWLPVLTVASFLIGFCGASVFPPISALVVRIFGIDALPKVLGLLGVMTLPFTFIMSAAAGWLHDLWGNYEPAFATLIATCLLAAAAFFGISRHLARMGAAEPDVCGGYLSPADPG